MHRNRLTAFVTGLALVGASPLIHAAPASATTTQHVVTTTTDVVDAGDGVLSLREAITAVDADPGDSEIVLQPGATYHLTICDDGVWEHENVSGDIDVDADPDLLTITGNGARIEQDCVDQRVMLTYRDLTIRDLTVAGADNVGATATGEDDGAGIYVYNPANFRSEDSTFTDLHAEDGPALYVGGDVELVRTVLTGNTATTGSSGIATRALNTILAIEDSLITDNSSATGAPVLSSIGTLDIRNTTIAGNHADASGNIYSSILYANTGIHLDHVTMVDNTQNSGATLFSASSVDLRASIIVNDSPYPECHASTPTTTSHGGNVVRDTSCGTATATDQTDVADPGLAALADNGGATRTMLPQPGSAAVDAEPTADCDLTTDQRGLHRPSGTACDAGAVEVQHRPDALLRRGTGSFVGDDVYNLTADGQTQTASVPRGANLRFGLRIQNDGDVLDTFVLRANTGRGAVTARYFLGADEITDLVGAGHPVPVDAGGFTQVSVRVHVSPTAPHRIARSFTFRVRSAGTTVADRARATVEVR
jgi:hypothetical protein